MQRLLRSGVIQAKLTISQPDDPAEQEADRVADAVMRMPDPSRAGRTPVTAAPPESRLQRICDECEDELHRQPTEEVEEEETLQAKTAPGHTPAVTPDLEAEVTALRGGGQHLPDSLRAFFEPRFGHDFSGIRVHTGNRAAESAHAVGARAFTVGRSIVLASGQYAPASREGQRLLAHELTHTIQQDRASNGKYQLQRAPECEAGKVADPDRLGPLFRRGKSEVESLDLTKATIGPPVQDLPYVLFSPHCEAGKVPLRALVEGSDTYIIRTGKIYKQVWAQQAGKPTDVVYWGWIHPGFVVTPPPAPPPPAAPPPPDARPSLSLTSDGYHDEDLGDGKWKSSKTIYFNVRVPKDLNPRDFVLVQWMKGRVISGHYRGGGGDIVAVPQLLRPHHGKSAVDFDFDDWVIDSPDTDPIYASDVEPGERWGYTPTSEGFRSQDTPGPESKEFRPGSLAAVEFDIRLYPKNKVPEKIADVTGFLPDPIDKKTWEYSICVPFKGTISHPSLGKGEPCEVGEPPPAD
jgi:hypothetical protein